MTAGWRASPALAVAVPRWCALRLPGCSAGFVRRRSAAKCRGGPAARCRSRITSAAAGELPKAEARGSGGRHDVRRYFTSFSYQARSWEKPRRVMRKVEWHLG
jgi:hypothetical protein